MIKILFGSAFGFGVFVFCIVALVVIITQIAIPLITDTPLFPIFSRKTKIKKEIHGLNEELEATDLEEQAEKLRIDLANKKEKPATSQTQTQQPQSQSSRQRSSARSRH